MFKANVKYWVWFGNEIMVLQKTSNNADSVTFDRFYTLPVMPTTKPKPPKLMKSKTPITIKADKIIACQEYFAS